MTPTKVSDLLLLLAEYDIRPNKLLSQNFLIDQNIAKKIIAGAKIEPNDFVLEIGPGAGALTALLISTTPHLTAIEKDPKLTRLLSNTIRNPSFALRGEDFLKTSYTPTAPIKVVSNVPYNISSPVIEKLTLWHDKLESITLMVQKEMAERISSIPPSKQNCAFSIFVHYYYHPKLLFRVSPSCFYPRPTVDSSVINLIPKESLPLKDPKNFFVFVELAFQAKRKMLQTTFKGPAMESALKAVGLSKTARPQELSVGQFLDIFRYLAERDRQLSFLDR